MSRGGIVFGDEAISALEGFQAAPDVGASSYWREAHRDFAYRDGRVSGKLSFGTFSRHLDAPHRLGHRLLQVPFRRLGAEFPTFRRLDAFGRAIARRHGRVYDLDMLRQALTVAFVEAKLDLAATGGPFFVIGDGYGVLTSLLLMAHPGRPVILANLTQTLLVDLIYIRRAIPGVTVALALDESGFRDALDRTGGGVIGLRADAQALASAAPIAAAFNVVSMQEMNPDVIAGYFETLRRTPGPPTWFYCCNRIDKTLPDGTVVRFDAYPWRPADEIAADGICPWLRYTYAPRWPIYRPYDGPTRHRLARLAKRRPDDAASCR